MKEVEIEVNGFRSDMDEQVARLNEEVSIMKS
jgi:hypothetical protein